MKPSLRQWRIERDEGAVDEAFFDNVFTEMTDLHLLDAARTRFQRMLERNRRP